MYAEAPKSDPLKVPDSRLPHGLADSVRAFDRWMDFQLIDISGVRVTLGSLIAAVLVLAVFLVASAVFRRVLYRYAKRHAQVNESSIYTVGRLVHYLLLIVGALLALNATGVPISKFAVFAGAVGVGLGLGLQGIFLNFVSGLVLLFERSLRVGDFVELASGVHGHVRDIHIRATRVTTNDDIDILVPNSEFVNGRVVNWTLREVARRLKVPFGVAYGTDKERVKKAALEAAADVPFTLSLDGPRAPQVWLTGFGDSSLDFQLVVWLNAEAVRRPASVTAAYYWALHTALEKHGIELPFPQRDLHIRSWVPPDGVPSVPVPSPLSPPPARDPHGNDAARDVQRDIAEEAAAAARDPSRTPH